MKARNLIALLMLLVLIYSLFSASSPRATGEIKLIGEQTSAANPSKPVPSQLNYEGYLADATDSSAVTATLAMTFRIFDTQTKGIELWSETHPAVEVNNGIFYVLLGSVTAFPTGLFDGSTRWLQTEVGTEILSPRKPLVSVAYSLRAEEADHAAQADDADLLQGQGLTDLDNRWVNQADLNHLDAADGDPANALSVDDAGKVGIGTTNPLTELEVNGSVTATTYYGDGSNLTGISGTPDDDWTISGNHMYSAVPGSVGIGTSSPTKLLEVAGEVKATSYYGDGSNLTGISGTTDNDWTIDGDDIYHQTGNVGIGTTSPQVKLSLGTDFAAKKLALWDGIGDFYGLGVGIGRITFYTNDTEKMTIYNNGRVGIGTTTPAAKLAIRNSGVADVNINSDSSYAIIRMRQNGVDKWAWAGELLSGRTSIYSYDLSKNVLVIENSGEIGVGTESPSEKLHVVGTIKSTSSDGRAVDGLTTSTDEWVPAVYGRNEGAGDGIYGWSQSRHGAFGITYSDNTDHAGVYGQNSGGGIGVYGQTTSGEGVKGKATGNGFGGWFRAEGNTGTGVHASCLGTSGIGIYAEGGTSGLAALFRGNVRIASKSTGDLIIELGEGLDYAEGFDVTDAPGWHRAPYWSSIRKIPDS